MQTPLIISLLAVLLAGYAFWQAQRQVNKARAGLADVAFRAEQQKLERDKLDRYWKDLEAKSKNPLPWKPFHPAPLKGGPERYLAGLEEDETLRAVMEILEEELSTQAEDFCRVGHENLERTAGMFEALRSAHGRFREASRRSEI